MSRLKFAINGFGRIGRLVARTYAENPHFQEKLELAAINDLNKPSESSHFLKYDSTHGKASFDIAYDDNHLIIGGAKVPITSERDPAQIPWNNYGVDLVFDCTGKFRTKETASAHLKSGVKKVIISAPGKNVDRTIVMGVNEKEYQHASDSILSNASCTTNCLAPLALVLDQKFKIKQGFITTIHSYTSDQRVIDNSHRDPRRARTAAHNIIPTTTGAAVAVGEVIPSLNGKLDGLAMRVPTPNVSITDLVAEIETKATAEEINEALAQAAKTTLQGILDVSYEPLVSVDYIGNPHSSIIDALSTSVIKQDASGKGNLIKVCSWYDNEVGFSHRMLDLASYIASQ